MNSNWPYEPVEPNGLTPSEIDTLPLACALPMSELRERMAELKQTFVPLIRRSDQIVDGYIYWFERMKIGELATRHGISSSAIRYYERKGLLSKVRRRNGVREFSKGDDQRLSVIQLAQSAGFTLEETKLLLHGIDASSPTEIWRTATQKKRADIQAAINNYQRMLGVLDTLLDCECPTLEVCGAEYSKRCSSESTQQRPCE